MENIWGYIVGATVFGSVTGFIILQIKNLLKNKINKRYAYLLWMILVIKLIIPFGPESNISLFNNIPINYKMENILSSNTTKLNNTNSNSNDTKNNNYINTEDTTNEVNSTVSTSEDNYSSNEDNESIRQNSQGVNNTALIPIVGINKGKLSTILSFVWLNGFIF